MIARILDLTRRIARDRTTRRQAISTLLTMVLVQLAVGVFVIDSALMSRPGVFAVYWLVCGWLTICVALLAAYDLLEVLRRARDERRAARRNLMGDPD